MRRKCGHIVRMETQFWVRDAPSGEQYIQSLGAGCIGPKYMHLNEKIQTGKVSSVQLCVYVLCMSVCFARECVCVSVFVNLQLFYRYPYQISPP